MATHTDDFVYVPSSENLGNRGGTAAIAIRRIRPELPPGATPGLQIVMVAGRTVPARVSFDLQTDAAGGRYSWARKIADGCQADVWIMEVQGMGASSRPAPMSNKCNILIEDQKKAFHNQGICGENTWEGNLGTSDSEWQELDAVVDHVRGEVNKENPSWPSQSTGRVVLIGYSAGAYAVGPYAMQHPEKVRGLLLLEPIFPPDGPADRPALPVSTPPNFYGTAMGCLTKEFFWPAVPAADSCPAEPNESVMDDLWAAMIQNEPYPNLVPEHEITLWPTRYWWGWNRDLVSANTQLGKDIPVLIIAGTKDTIVRAPKEKTDGRGPFSVDSLYEAIAGRGKAMMYYIECASHLIVWQDPYRHRLHDLSIEWLMGFANYIGPPSNPAFTPLILPYDGSGEYFVPRDGGPPQTWAEHQGLAKEPGHGGLQVTRPGG